MNTPKRFDCFDDASIKALAQTLGKSDLITGRDITNLLKQAHLPSTQENATKWKRIYASFYQFQHEERTSNNILLFIRLALAPASFTEHVAEYQELVEKTNKILAFSGLELQNDGKIHRAWDEAVLLEIHDDYLIFGNDRTKVTESDGRSWRTKEPAVM